MANLSPLIERIEDFSIQQDTDGKSLYFTGPFIVMDKKNSNGRKYLSKWTIPVVEDHIEQYVNKNKSVGELDHPTSLSEIPKIHLDNITHRITELKLNGSIYYGKARIINAGQGLLVKGLHEAGITLGASSRALGNTDENGNVQNGMILVTPADIVYSNSAIEAVMDGIYESVEFVKPAFGESELFELKDLMKNRRNWLSVNNTVSNRLRRGFYR